MDACPTLSSPPPLLTLSFPPMSARNVTLSLALFFFLFPLRVRFNAPRGEESWVKGSKESLHRSIVAGNTFLPTVEAWNWDKSTTCAGDFHAREREKRSKFATLMSFKTSSCEQRGTGRVISKWGRTRMTRNRRRRLHKSVVLFQIFEKKEHVEFEIFGGCTNFHNFSPLDYLRFCKWNEEWIINYGRSMNW